MAAGLLSGFIVVEIAHPLTEYAGLVLAGLGAEVFLVEPPSGASTRERRPRVPNSGESLRGSIPFLARNTNKKSVVVDLDRDEDRALLAGLLARADAVLDADGSHFHEAVAASAAPSVVTVTDERGLGVSSIVGFAASGGLSSSGWPHQPPCNAPSWLALDGAGIYAATMALVAAWARRHGVTSVHYEIPYEEAAVAAITPWTRPLHSYGMTVSGQGITSARMGAGPYPVYEASDGYVRVLTATPKQWDAFLALLGHPEALAGDEWNTPQFRAENFDAIFYIASEITKQRTVQDLFHEGQRLGLTITPVYTVSEFLDDPHVRERAFTQTVEDPEFGTMQLLRPPYRPTPADLAVPIIPAPALGAHTDEARALVEHPIAPVATEPAADFDLARPLARLRVLELGVGAVVPEAASFLALLGADVLKVESLKHVDFLRQIGLNGYLDVNNCPTFNQMNLGVQSIAVDMTAEDGKALVQQFSATCDVVMDNMRGTIAARWGLDDEAVRARRSDVLYLSSQGLGDGPYGDYQTYGPNLQTFAAVTSQWAHPDDPYPVGTTLNHPDHVAGKQALVPLLAALLRREETGEGCHLECAQFEVPAYMISDRFLGAQLLPDGAQPLGNRSRDMAPHGCYPCAGDDQWCAIAVETDAQWQALRGVLQAPWADAPELATADGRLAAAEEIDAHLAEWTRQRRPDEVETLLRGAGVPVSRLLTGDDFAADEAANDGGIFAAVDHPTAGARWHTGVPVIADSTGRPPIRRAPLLGEQTGRLLYDLLGIDSRRGSQLIADGTVGY